MNKKFLALALVIFSLVACKDAGLTYAPQPISFAGKPVMHINVAEIKVVDQFRSTMAAPYVEYQLPTAPAAAVKQWAGQRLAAVGRSGVLEITIEDASVKETNLKTTEGIKGIFTNDESERYDAHLAVTMKLYDGVNVISVAEGNVEVSKMNTVNEKATAAERDKLFHDMIADMMAQFDAQAETRLHQYFTPYLS
jgi:hypothetical protein